MTVEPYASARTVFWIVDNGSSHAGNTSIRRMEEKWKNARLIHLPIHASWLNQIELYFSIVQRKALTPNDFDSLDALAERLLALRRPLPPDRATVRLDLHPRRPRGEPTRGTTAQRRTRLTRPGLDAVLSIAENSSRRERRSKAH